MSLEDAREIGGNILKLAKKRENWEEVEKKAQLEGVDPRSAAGRAQKFEEVQQKFKQGEKVREYNFPKEKPSGIDLSQYDAKEIYGSFYDCDGHLSFAAAKEDHKQPRTFLYYTDPDGQAKDIELSQPLIEAENNMGYAVLLVNVFSFFVSRLGLAVNKVSRMLRVPDRIDSHCPLLPGNPKECVVLRDHW
jgi:hypothetical protein